IHGSGDRPDWQCFAWRRIVDGHAFVLCPTGAYNAQWSTKNDERYTHAGGPALLQHIDDAIAPLAARYPEYVDTRSPPRAGFSLGAYSIVPLAVADPKRFPRVAVVEGGASAWTQDNIKKFVAGGGQRVIFAAGQKGNEWEVKAGAKRFDASGAEARAVYAE